MVKKILVSLLLVWGALILFMPKEEIYFSLERELAKQGVEINEAHIDEGLFTLKLEGVTVYVKGIEVATLK
jgi:predicted ribosome-associated RNA-binding protein Tma20